MELVNNGINTLKSQSTNHQSTRPIVGKVAFICKRCYIKGLLKNLGINLDCVPNNRDTYQMDNINGY